MPKQIDHRELDEIVKIIALFSKGASLKEISDRLNFSFHHRSLQRRLAFLVKQGKILVLGGSRSRRYVLSTKKREEQSGSINKEEESNSVPLSPKARESQKRICRPVQTRPYVNYNRDFLDEYQPNRTYYLSESERSHFLKIGKTDGEQPAGTYARQIFNRLLIDLTWNSSRLEGNTYSLLETERLLELSERSEGKDLSETQMILNHKAAIEFLVEGADDVGVNRYTILNLHALLSNNLLGNQEACGRLRDIPIAIAKSVYYPTAIIQLIGECFQLIVDKAQAIHDPFEQAFFLAVHLPYLQPFEDVNKRVSRLAANIPLICQNLCPLSFVDVPQKTYIEGLLAVYELNRIDLLHDVFLWAYERSCLLYSVTQKTLGQPDPMRMKYHSLIFETVTEVVLNHLEKKRAIELLREKARQNVSAADRARFIEAVENELRGMHEGNIARFRLRPCEYSAWRKIWR